MESKNDVLFSYTVAMSIKAENKNATTSWIVAERGSEKLEETQKYEISLTTIRSAKEQIERYIRVSSCYQSSLHRRQGFDIYLKKEQDRRLQSVKERGVVYTLLKLSKEQKRKGVITISSDSFGYILCYYGNQFDIPVTVVMPTSTRDDYFIKCRETGSRATVLAHGTNMFQAYTFALRLVQKDGLFYLDGNDHPNMIIGQATLGIEIMNQVNIDAVILPTEIDNCGLTAGIATAIKEVNRNIVTIEVLPKSRKIDSFVENIKRRTLPWDKLIPPTTHEWLQSPRESLFDMRYEVPDKLISSAKEILRVTEGIVDYRAAVGLALFATNELNMLKRKRIVIFSFGGIDSGIDLLTHRSDPPVPRAGSSHK